MMTNCLRIILSGFISTILSVSLIACKANYIHENGIGQLRIGMNYEEAKKVGPQFKYILREGLDTEEGYQYRIASIVEKNQTLMTLTLSENKEIVSITIYSPIFRTKEGISVGSMISDVIRHYPDYVLDYPGEPILAPKGSHLVFVFAPSSTTANFARGIDKYTEENIPVSYIRISKEENR